MSEQTPSVATTAATVVDELMVLAEAATGYRQRLERMGWSPTAAEHAALGVLVRMNDAAFSGIQQTRGKGRG